MLKPILLLSIAMGALGIPTTTQYVERRNASALDVHISVAEGLLESPIDGRLLVIFAPEGTDPLDDTGVETTHNFFFGKNVFEFSQAQSISLSGNSSFSTETEVYGWPYVSLNDIPPGNYSVQAFLTKYEKVQRSDSSVVSVRFPCGDGAPSFNGPGSLKTNATDYEVLGGQQTLKLLLNNVTSTATFDSREVGGCNQGNYKDTRLLKYVKIRSKKLSEFWGRDMYVGANVLLPAGYNAKDTATRYPVIYSQGHWPEDGGAFGYSPNSQFAQAWDNGTFPATGKGAPRPVPKLILVHFRHEAPYYDASYAVNTANLGPYGDALNDELIPYIDESFNTIPEPYARIQEGASTGGWASIASVIFRPDLFGACFSSYPDSLDFHKHQAIELYTSANAYQRSDGSLVPSIRRFKNGTEVVVATVAQENHWELTFGTASRSSEQWDIWNAVFGVQGYNNYPLEPWDKVTGEIYPEAVEYWKAFDLSNYVTSNWNASRKLGEALAGRLNVWAGAWDTYYLNEAVQEFRKRTNAVGGAGWANITILPERAHGGYYLALDIWDYLDLLDNWIKDHAPDGPSPLSSSATAPSTRGNEWKEVIERGGHQAALARQAPPSIAPTIAQVGGPDVVQASVGRWDPGVVLKAQWAINDKPTGDPFDVKQGTAVKYTPGKRGKLQLLVTGSKRNYATETRRSTEVMI